MKKIILFLTFACAISSMQAQTVKDVYKERQEIQKYTRKQLNKKVSKDAKNTAKALSKEGWEVAPGALPLEKQLDRGYMMQYEYDEQGIPMYIMADAITVGETYDAAKMQALEDAKRNLASQLQTEVRTLVESTVANHQIDPEDAVSITRSIAASKQFISQSIGRIEPVVELHQQQLYRKEKVLVRIAYNSKMAKAIAKQAIQHELGEDGQRLQQKLDNILGL